jgi:hypothetical protein
LPGRIEHAEVLRPKTYVYVYEPGKEWVMRETVELSIPFEFLIGAVEKLGMPEKQRLWELLEEQLAQADGRAPQASSY